MRIKTRRGGLFKKLSIALLVLCSLCLVGCTNETVHGDDLFSRIYEFDNYEDYKVFYDNFCKYNEQAKFIVPKSTEQIEFNYVFHVTAFKKDEDKDEFTLKYFNACVCAEVKNLSGYNLIIEAYNVYYDDDSEINNIAEIRYIVKYDKYRDLNDIDFYIGYSEIARIYEVTNEIVNSDGFTILMNNILEAYKGGV